MSSNNSPCAACKIQRRKCTQECVFAPYFPPDNPQRFAYVHKVFGASNVAKLLNDLSAAQREDAVKSLAYEAEARLRDPVYGCVGLISLLQHKLKQLQAELNHAKTELANYIGPHAPALPLFQPPQVPLPRNNNNNHLFSVSPFGAANPTTAGHEVMLMQQHEFLGLEGGSGSQSGFNGHMAVGPVVSPSLALGPVDHPHHHLQQQLHAHQSLVLQKQPKWEGEKGRASRSAGPSCC